MNICIISQRYPYKDNMEFVFVKKLVDEWAKLGHRCVVITSFPILVYARGRIKYKPAYYRDQINENTFVDIYNPRTLYIPKAGKMNVLFGSKSPIRVIENTIKKIGVKFDFIYCHFFQPSVNVFRYAVRNSIPFFVATGESRIPDLEIPFSAFTKEEYRNNTTGVIAVSSKNKAEAANKGLIESSKCHVFPNGTDLEVFRRKDKETCRRKLGIPNDVFIVICVGFFCNRKGQMRILSAINKLNTPNIKAIFLGSPTPLENIKLEGENVLFKGSVSNKLLPDFLNAADVFCLPTQDEGCCNAVIEAMACGCSIISSNRPFNYDVLNKSNSILVNPDDIDEISLAIKKLYINSELRVSLSNKAFEDSRALGIDQRATKILNYISSVI